MRIEKNHVEKPLNNKLIDDKTLVLNTLKP